MHIIIGILVAVVLGFLGLAASAYVVMLNVNDIIASGANFWNVFWILLVGVILFGGAGKAAS